MGMALTSCTPPAKGSPLFELGDEITDLLAAPAEITIRTF
jgi:hypothetical protein